MGIINKFLTIKKIEEIYGEIQLDRIYFNGVFTKDGEEILFIERELRYCPIDININNKTFDLNYISDDDVVSIYNELKKMKEEFKS